MKNKKVVILILAILSLPTLHAQWKTNLEVGGNYYQGNVNKSNLKAGGHISHKDTTFEFSANVKAVYGETENKQDNQEIQATMKYDRNPNGLLSPFLGVELYNNKYKGIDLKSSGFLGVKYIVYKKEKIKFSLSSAVMYSAEKYIAFPDPTASIADNKNFIRFSIRPKLDIKLSENISLKNYTFYKPEIKDFSNNEVDAYTSLSIKINKNLSVAFNHEYHFKSNPPNATLKKDDAYLTGSIKISF